MDSTDKLDVVGLDVPLTFQLKPVGLDCPYCGIVPVTGLEIPKLCKHIVFCYDWTNGAYVDIDPSFKAYLEYLSKDKMAWKDLGEDLKSEIEEFINDKMMPTPDLLRDVMEHLNLFEVYSIDGSHGNIWGHASEDFLDIIDEHI